MTNVYQELESLFKEKSLSWDDIIAAEIWKNKSYPETKDYATLQRNHTWQDQDNFVYKLIDMDYEQDSYDDEKLLGTIWLSDNRWLQRINDKWQLFVYPEFPNHL